MTLLGKGKTEWECLVIECCRGSALRLPRARDLPTVGRRKALLLRKFCPFPTESSIAPPRSSDDCEDVVERKLLRFL